MHINKNSKGNSVQRCAGGDANLQFTRMKIDSGTRRAIRSKRYTPNGARECARRLKRLGG
jgi:hypothetical protein